MKKFCCMPMARVVPMMFLLAIVIWVAMISYYKDWGNEGIIPFTIAYILLCLVGVFFTLPYAMRRVEIYKDKIVCKGLFPSQTYEIEYEKCNLGINYSWTRNGNIWWLYICYGQPPKFKSTSLDRIAALKFRPGFIKMHYSEDVYSALLEVLPKQKRYSLMSAKKWAEKAKIKWHYN